MTARKSIFTLALFLLTSSITLADVIHDESSNGDLSSDNLAPTALTFAVGSNDILGSTTNSPLDRDFWTFELGANQQLDSVLLLNYDTTQTQSFFAVASGTQVSSVVDASVLLGNSLVGNAHLGTDVLDELGSAQFGGTGFTGPLGAGDYTFWFQETAANTNYTFQFNVTAVPEPNLAMALALGAVMTVLRRRRS